MMEKFGGEVILRRYEVRWNRQDKRLVHPAPMLVLLLLVAHVNFKLLARLGALPFVVLKLPTIRQRPAAQEKESEEHAAEVSKVADVGVGL